MDNTTNELESLRQKYTEQQYNYKVELDETTTELESLQQKYTDLDQKRNKNSSMSNWLKTQLNQLKS